MKAFSGTSQAEWFLVKAKVALAAAVIRTRPSGLSGREYAEALACKLKSRDEGWRRKAQELQQEVLRLRQEVLMSRAALNAAGETPGREDDVDSASQDLFGPESAGHSAELQPDSETPELLPAGLQGRSLDPLPHVRFLQSLCALRRVTGKERGLECLWFGPDGDAGAVLVDSACQLLDSVVAACRDPPPTGPLNPVPQACRVVAGAMDLFCCQRPPSAEFTRRVEEPLRELTEMLLRCGQLGRLQAAETLTECLIALGSSSMSRSFLIRHLLAQIGAVADQLWQAFQGQEDSGLEKFPVDQYHNSCYLFWILEKLLQDSKVPYRVAAGSDETGFLTHLERRSFLLSDEFPLFSICMWRVRGLLTSSDR